MILNYKEILATNLGCQPEAIADKLFPINRGFTEEERISNLNAIYNSMRYVFGRTKRNYNHR
jgi:hypothetical protein